MKKIDYRKLCHPANPEFRLATSPFYLMAHADFDYHEDMSTVLEKYGVNRSMYRIMTVLREHESANIGFLAERSLTKRNTASRIIERMVAKELVSAFPNPHDSRITEVVLTQRGKDMLDSLTPIVGRQFQRAVDGITNEELEQLVLVLQKISSNLNRLPIEVPGDVSADGRVGITRLHAGQAWVAGETGPAGITTVSRIEVAEARGHGIRLLNESPSAALRASVKTAKDYLYLHAADLVGTRNPKDQELIVEVHPLNGRVGGSSGVGLLLALCSSLLKKQLRGGLVIVGELAGDAVKPIQQPAELVETAVREGARAILMPVSCRRALLDVPDEVATNIEMLFYADASDALKKALQE
ncbi:MAG: MarR family transcriptional regulator [Gammaproteobacteria bacterium]|jgi:DNA-binding MarR family transcriptional regulator|nr:MarR family transcriptional regulator [Gammaproteobacteria bacterium]